MVSFSFISFHFALFFSHFFSFSFFFHLGGFMVSSENQKLFRNS
jgi:hypothetical protein